ncbi:MAG: hypothetical protein QOH14_1018 [Pseudonocardiales bacterium]|jgi:hypothetical protein|nr:hypothetical protein [Pseudonocardiales bacterium]
MPGRRQQRPAGRFGLRWVAGAVGIALAGGTAALAMQSAHAAAPSVDATFSVTGVTTSNCGISAGGNDVYVTPGGAVNFKTSVASLNLLGFTGSTAGLAGLDGALEIDPSSATPTRVNLTTTKAITVTGLSTGNHTYKFTAKALDLFGIPIALGAGNTSVSGGASLNYGGIIHVTDQAALCGIAIQVPGVHVSASASGLPPIDVSLPPLSAPTVPIPTLTKLPNVLPPVPVTSTTVPAGSNAGGHTTGAECVPCEVVPNTNLGSGFGGVSANADSLTQIGSALHEGPALGPAPTADATSPDTTTTTKRIDLAANKAPAAQMPVLLAIIAIIALSLVTATYARLYLLRRNI